MPLHAYDPAKYVTPKKVKEVTEEYENRIATLEQTIIGYQRQIAEKDEIIEKYRDRNDILTNKLNMIDEIISEKESIEQELINAKQRLMGKDKTIAHLKARHPHESTTVAQLEQRINELNLQIKGYKDQRTKMDQTLGHLTRQRDENKEMVKRKNEQIKPLEELTEQITLERNDLLKNKHDILKEYTQLQRLTCHPIISKETQTITQQERPKKEARQQLRQY